MSRIDLTISQVFSNEVSIWEPIKNGLTKGLVTSNEHILIKLFSSTIKPLNRAANWCLENASESLGIFVLIFTFNIQV